MMRTQFTLFSAFKISQIVETRLLLIVIEYKYKNDLHMEVVQNVDKLLKILKIEEVCER